MQKNLNIEKIIFKVVQMKFLAMHITNQKLSFDIFTVGNVLNIFMEHDLNILMIFGIKKMIILTLTVYCCLLLQIYPSDLRLLLCPGSCLFILQMSIFLASMHRIVIHCIDISIHIDEYMRQNSSPNTNDLCIWIQSFHTFQNC